MPRRSVDLPFPITPMLAAHAPGAFHRAGWLYEEKCDGYRIVAYKQGRTVRLLSRTGRDWSERFADVAKAITRMPARRLILDGEVAVFDHQLVSRIELLRDGAGPLMFMVFDCLFRDGRDLRQEPLVSRRAALEQVIDGGLAHVFTARRLAANGLAAFRQVEQRGYEGLVAKDPQSRYVSGRSSHWVKVKQRQEGEFVIGGFTGVNGGVTSLLVGEQTDQGLRYVGEVELGMRFVRHSSAMIRIPALITSRSPFINVKRFRRATWVKPTLVAAVSFQEWLSTGHLRHACYRGLQGPSIIRD
jgi:bifunctional non-homologous end joining protein LigD